MNLEEIQQNAIRTYQENISYFKEKDKELYEKIVLFEEILNSGQYKQTLDLEYKDSSYFDILYLNENRYFYNQNSLNYSKDIVDTKLNFDSKKDSFKSFYEYNYSDEFYNESLNINPYHSMKSGNAAIIHYVNKNTKDNSIENSIFKFMIFGVGLGFHIPLIHKKINSKLYLIIEPNLEIFRLSLFTTNYFELSKESTLIFSINDNEDDFRKKFETFYQEMFILNHYLKFFMFYNNNDFYVNIIQNYLVSQGHILYPYDKVFESFSRTLSIAKQDYSFLDISKKVNLEIFKKPVLLLAAGPSLQKNIEFVKMNQNKFLIIAVYSIMPILEKNSIKPDIITQYDQKIETLNVLEKIKDINFFDETIFILASHIPNELLANLKKENIYVFQGKSQIKKDFGYITSPSIGEISYALLLIFGAKEIYFLGLDMAMDPESGKTHADDHDTLGAFEDLDKEIDKTNFSFRGSKFTIPGNFVDFVETTAVFKASINHINYFSKLYKDESVNVYNLSNGALFENILPLKTEDINLENSIEKSSKIIKDYFISISEDGLNENDKKRLEKKLSEAKEILKYIEQFSKIKNGSFENFRKNLILLLQNILFKEYQCKDDLIDILMNFTYHNLHYVFYFINLKKVDNPKKHIKILTNNISLQYKRFVEGYIKELEK